MSAASDSLERNKGIVTEFLEAFSSGDVPGLLARMHHDGTWWVSGTVEGISGTYDKAKFAALLKGVAGVYKTGALRITPRSMVAEGNRVAVEAESYGELKNGRIYNCLYHFLFEIADGKVLRVKEYMDTKHLHDVFVAP